MGQGWIKLHRKLRDCDLWNCEPFSRGQAWVDLLLMVNHDEKKVVLGSQVVVVKRGQTITSIRKLSEKWHWGNKKTLAFLGQLEELNMIHRESDTKKTLLTVINYDDYQLQGNTDDHTDDNTDDNTDDHTNDTQTRSIRNIKNKNNINAHSEEDELFEKLWQQYPFLKEGKSQVTKKAKKELLKVGEEELVRCIQRFKARNAGKDPQYIMRGRTFFTSGYVDYLDKNFETVTPIEEHTGQLKRILQ